jgi:hypothetical protein
VTKYRERLEAGEYAAPASGDALDGMTKQELLDYAAAHNIDGVSNAMSKADILSAVKEAG